MLVETFAATELKASYRNRARYRSPDWDSATIVFIKNL